MLRVRLPVHVKRELHESAEALLARPLRVLDPPAPRAEFGQEQAENDEDRDGQHMVRRRSERIHRGDEPVGSSTMQISELSKPGPRPPYQALRITAAIGSW